MRKRAEGGEDGLERAVEVRGKVLRPMEAIISLEFFVSDFGAEVERERDGILHWAALSAIATRTPMSMSRSR